MHTVGLLHPWTPSHGWKILFSILGWLNPQNLNLQIGRADLILVTL